MLTLKQIQDIKFTKTFFGAGYKGIEVDDFIDKIIENFNYYENLENNNNELNAKVASLEGLKEKNQELNDKLAILANRINSAKREEESIKDALLSVTQVAAEAVKGAKDNAKKLVDDAEIKAKNIVLEAEDKSEAIIKEYESKIKDAKANYEKQIASIDKAIRLRTAAKEQEFYNIKTSVSELKSSLFEMYRTHLAMVENMPDFDDDIAHIPSMDDEPVQPEVLLLEVLETQVANRTQQMANVTDETVNASDFEDIENINDAINTALEGIDTGDIFEDFSKIEKNFNDILGDGATSGKTFKDIDLNAYSDIPEALKTEKENKYNTLEFGDGIHFKN